MKLKDPLFYAKVLLFGEYGIIKDSMGLSIPYNLYKGKLLKTTERSDATKESNAHIRLFFNYLQDLRAKGELLAELDLDRFDMDIKEGMHFESNIPQGFGVGSSGALCAAVYDKYAINKIDPARNVSKDNILELKKVFGQFESFFHGKSSGLDPLICYLNIPILIKSKDEIDTVGIPHSANGEGAIFLLNSGAPGKTQPMVSIFMEKMKEEGFRKMVAHQFKKYNDECIHAFLNRDFKPLFTNIKQLSELVLQHFTPMIPERFHKLWKDGIESNAYYLKLCGSGGGGYILGFTENLPEARKKLKGHDLEVIFSF